MVPAKFRVPCTYLMYEDEDEDENEDLEVPLKSEPLFKAV